MIGNFKTKQIVLYLPRGKYDALRNLPKLLFGPLTLILCLVLPQAIEKYCLLSILLPLTCHFSTIQNSKS